MEEELEREEGHTVLVLEEEEGWRALALVEEELEREEGHTVLVLEEEEGWRHALEESEGQSHVQVLVALEREGIDIPLITSEN